MRRTDLPAASLCARMWTAVAGDEHSGDCDGCGRPVFDLSALSRAEASALLRAEWPAWLCVRCTCLPDGRVLFKDDPAPPCPRGGDGEEANRADAAWAVRQLRGAGRSLRACVLSADARVLVTWAQNDAVGVWSVALGTQFWEVPRLPAGVSGCAPTPDGARVVCAGLDGVARVFDVHAEDDGQVLRAPRRDEGALALLRSRWSDPCAPFQTCAVTPDGRTAVVLTGVDLAAFDLDTGALLSTGPAGDLGAWTVTEDSRRLSWLRDGRTVCSRRLRSKERESCRHLEDGDRVAGLAFSPNATRGAAVTLSRDAVVVLDLISLQEVARARLPAPLSRLALTPDGRSVLAACGSAVHVLDADSGALERQLGGHGGAVTHLVPLDAGRLVSADSEGVLRLWHLASGACLASVRLDGPVTCLSAAGAHLAAADAGGGLWLLTLAPEA